ncbi:MAG: HetP family heterocyst commitment protein [Nostoc sp. ZfuVER08]|nr:HetP family heterocyst commitment protein [Nostoc sp. ZfuVER08]
MNEDFPDFDENLHRTAIFNPQELEEIINAIKNGKYSWACLLMLRFSGFNPLEYIPSRTYIRLMKNNWVFDKSEHQNLGFFQLESTWFQQSNDKHSSN